MWPFTRKKKPAPVLAVKPVLMPEPVVAVEVVEVARVREGLCQCGKLAAMTQAGPGAWCSRCILRGVSE